MALIYRVLQVLVLGVTAAAVDDIPITWSQGAGSAFLQCEVADWHSLQPRRTLPLDDARSRPNPYTWTRDGEHVSPKRVSQNGTLEVSHNSSSSSEGLYQCAVQHHGGRVLGYPIRLKFSFMDKQFKSQPEDVTAWLGQPLSIPCRIGSGPPASISWTRDGVDLPRTHRYHFLESELLIIDIRREDSGLYRCLATNSNLNRSVTSHEGRVVVEDSPLIQAAFLPVQHERRLVARAGARLLLPCPLVGWPRPKVMWELVPKGGSPRRLKSRDEVLVLDKLEYNQEGVYSCTVEGQNELSKTFTVILTEPVKITLPPQSKEAIRASTVRFNCTAEGRPAPTVTWYKDGQILALAGRINIRKSADRHRMELVIGGVASDDAGNYQCFASSEGVMASSWARLSVLGSGAEAPEAVWCAPAGGSAVALRWRPPAAAADGVIAYTVDTATDKHGSGTTGAPTVKTEMIVKVKDPLKPYVFQVRAYVTLANKSLATDMSQSVVCQGQGVPIKLTKLKHDKVLVSWKQFSEQHPGVVQWILQYRHENYTEDEHNVTLASHVTNYTLAAPSSSPLLVRLLGSRTSEWLKQNLTLVPWTSTTSNGQDDNDRVYWSEPRDLELTEVSERGFTVRWTIDHHEEYSYLVCVRAMYGNDDCQESYKTSATIEGLQPATQYEVRVQVRVPGRTLGGPFTEPYHITTQPEGPDRFNLTYEFVNASTVRVSWRGRVARYSVQHSAHLKLPLERWSTQHTVGNTVLITGVDPDEQIYVVVEGYDPPSYSTVLTVPARIEDLEAKDLKYEYIGSGVSVSWSGAGPRTVRFAQNITQPLENWSSINVTAAGVEIPVAEPRLPVFVMVSAGGAQRHHVLTIPPRPITYLYYYLGAGGACLLCVVCAGAGGALLCARRAKDARPDRSRGTHATPTDGAEEGSEMRVTRAHNGAAAEPLLNGHVHITENPASKTPNGRLKKGRRVETPAYDAFDMSRPDADTTVETVLDDTTYNLLDTSRRPEFDVSRSSRELSANNSFHKLPDDNMNSELTRSTEFQLDNSKIHPTLQPNG